MLDLLSEPSETKVTLFDEQFDVRILERHVLIKVMKVERGQQHRDESVNARSEFLGTWAEVFTEMSNL